MIGALVYNLIEFFNYYLAYKYVMNIRFTRNKAPYLWVLCISSAIQIVVYCQVDNTWRDIITIGSAFFCMLVVTESKRWKVIVLYPIVVFGCSLLNTIGSYVLARLIGFTQREVMETAFLVCISECTGIVIMISYHIFRGWTDNGEVHFTISQYILFYVSIGCLFTIVAFAQGLFSNGIEYWNEIKGQAMAASVVLAICFLLLSISLQKTWKETFQYKLENEKYDLFLRQQEKHIGMLIAEDEKWRKLRHDMSAHMLALDTMIETEEWSGVRQYFRDMKNSIGERSVEKYTNISAVDAVIGVWSQKAVEKQIMWSWEGNMVWTEQVTVFELCTVFENLLSNAIEATEQADYDKIVQVKVANFYEHLIISVKNTCDQSINTKSRPASSKKDDVFHGLGLRNVEEIVKKYNGSIEYVGSAGWFQVDIVL